MPENQTSTNVKKNLSVLITGGGGLIGKYLTTLLQDTGYMVSHLSRTGMAGNVKTYKWDPENGIIDTEALEGIDFIIHLAGANIGEKRWTGKRKKEIIESRVNSARLLYKTISERAIRLKGFISASATGIYGSQTSSTIFNEKDPPGEDFLGTVCKKWEEAAGLFNNSGIRTVIIRSAIVLEKNDSALSKLMMPGRFGFLIRTGSGQQYMPWIHINDLCRIYAKAIEDQEMKGAYNAAAPSHLTHNEFIKILGKVMNLPVLPVPVPGFIIRTILGEMSDVILKGTRVSSEKIIKAGYECRYADLEAALRNIISA
jgi:uncharacterized protein (TIGR01777 family)